MQSECATSPVATTRPPAGKRPVGAIVWFALVPALGLFAEVMTGALSSWLPLFPTWWHVGFVVAAVTANVFLHCGFWAGERWLWWRVVATGAVAGMALLYGLAEAPALPAMLLLSWCGLGILAAAPYLTAFGMFRLVPPLVQAWRAAGRSTAALVVVLVTLAVLPSVIPLLRAARREATQARLVALAESIQLGAPADEVERLAGAVRADAVDEQRTLCRDGQARGWRDDGFGAGFAWLDGGPGGHLANGREFWFLSRRSGDRPPRAAVPELRVAFHRAHGFAWDDAAWSPWSRDASRSWRSLRVLVRPEAKAGLAYVEHLLEAQSTSRREEEAWFDVRLPAGAVASSLSLWIDGEERPAAFGGAAQVGNAYAAVVRRNLDPALLQEKSPGLLQLRLFPLASRLPPMRVRLGFTVPLRLVGDAAELTLPRIVAHNCHGGAPTSHSLVLAGEAEAPARIVGEAELARPIRLAGAVAAAQASDAQGFVVQRLVRREPLAAPERAVVVLDASASVRAAGVDPLTVLAALPASTTVRLFAAHGNSFATCDAAAGSTELAVFVRGQSFTGGVDARAALAAATAAAATLGVPQVLWLHGATAVLHDTGREPAMAGPIAALALHPGSNLLRERLAQDSDVRDVPRYGDDSAAMASALAEFVRFGVGPGDAIGEFERHWTRLVAPASGVPVVSDQLARLWAAGEARSTARGGDLVAAQELSVRYRVVTAGAGAVVLENARQYAQHGLEPGAPIGSEPIGPIGGGPVPELSTWLMLASGLLLAIWCRRGRAA